MVMLHSAMYSVHVLLSGSCHSIEFDKIVSDECNDDRKDDDDRELH